MGTLANSAGKLQKDNTLIQYRATDGTDVKLSPAIVAKYVITGNGNASDKDIFTFMAMCRARGLNPLARDAYMTVYRNRDGSTNTTVTVSKDYYLRTAAQQPTFDGVRAGVTVLNLANGNVERREGSLVFADVEKLIGGWADAYDKGRAVPSHAEVSMTEYDLKRALWKEKPATMIRKVALVQALRELYPQAFGGLYDGSEMPEPPIVADSAPSDVEPLAVEPVEDENPADAATEPQQANRRAVCKSCGYVMEYAPADPAEIKFECCEHPAFEIVEG